MTRATPAPCQPTPVGVRSLSAFSVAAMAATDAPFRYSSRSLWRLCETLASRFVVPVQATGVAVVAGGLVHVCPSISAVRGTAGPQSQPCAVAQPSPRRSVTCSVVSTPSATTATPTARARSTIHATMARASRCSVMSATKLRSIFSAEMGRSRR